jgi:cytochrome P450
VVRVSKDPLTFSWRGVLMDSDTQVSLVTTDAPGYHPASQVVSRGFTPRMVAQYGERIRRSRQLLDRMRRAAGDLVEDVAVLRCCTSSPRCSASAARISPASTSGPTR